MNLKQSSTLRKTIRSTSVDVDPGLLTKIPPYTPGSSLRGHGYQIPVAPRCVLIVRIVVDWTVDGIFSTYAHGSVIFVSLTHTCNRSFNCVHFTPILASTLLLVALVCRLWE